MISNKTIQTKNDIIDAWIHINDTLSSTVLPLSEEQWIKRPTEKWSIAGHVEHLFLSGNPVSSALKLPKEQLEGRFGLYEGSYRSFETLQSIYKEQLKKTPIPVNPIAPSDTAIPKPQLLESWAMIKAKIPQRLKDWTEEELDRYCLIHPLLGPLSVRGMLFFTVFHTDHHLETIRHLCDK